MKNKTSYVCQACGYRAPKWLGRCPDCGGWNTLVEERSFVGRKKGLADIGETVTPQPISTLNMVEEDRIKTEIRELDRVLGGGIVLGSTILIGGDPGIGKSTLLLKAMGMLADLGNTILYVSGEESPRQIKMRGERLGVSSENLLIYPETSLDNIIKTIKTTKPGMVVIDSIQTLYSENLESSPGSVSQLRECAAQIILLVKKMEIPVFLVGHVTKDGSIAGPRVLEHMVDAVLYFEGERGYPFRILRAVKNRFGSVMEIGVFEMKNSGLEEVSNPSAFFLAERPVDASGSVVVSSLEGSRPILVELQSLISPTTVGIARRTIVGIDHNRVAIIVAILEKKAGMNLANHDIFFKVAGGIKLMEPAIDLGIGVSIASNFLDKAIDPNTVVFGEVGLGGEIRVVSQADLRIREAHKLGFTRCIMPKDSLKSIKRGDSLDLIAVSSIAEVIDVLF